MTLNASGPISLAGSTTGQSIALELGLSATGTISLNQANVRTLAGVASGAITMPTNFWGKSNSVPTIIMSMQTTPFVGAWQYSSSTGWGTRFANPAVLPGGSVLGEITTNTGNTAYAMGQNTTPFINAWTYSSTAGFGTKYANPGTLLGSGQGGPQFAPDNAALIFATAFPLTFIFAYRWTNASGFGTLYSNVATAPIGNSYSVDINDAGNRVAVGFITGSDIPLNVYPFSSSTGWGSKFAGPGIYPSNSTAFRNVKFNAASTVLAGVISIDSYLWFFRWSTSGFGTRYAFPGTLPTGNPQCLAWHPNQTIVAIAGNNAPFQNIYAWTDASGFGTRYADPSSALLSYANSVTFSVDGNSIVFAQNNTNSFQALYGWSGGYGTKRANPASLPQGIPNQIITTA